ncbi:DUF2059 domain-containing protein [Sulfitobacter noctilucae]|uniref:DUF2059 domain-containing protein n=1 Tax=Sulfitobacter noctilucae TaxID=1342302 RepID=UPI00046AF539|nr:DUF2059 domain-containing protein [Sulfitobacter noctilucae]
MRRAFLFAPVVFLLATAGAWADARMAVLVDVLKLTEAADILSSEGLAQAESLDDEMLDGQGGAGWAQQVESIYAPGLMVERVREELARELSGEALEEVITFYGSEKGSQIIDLENAARRAMQDPDVEEAARARFVEIENSGDLQLSLIMRYVEDGDMIARNVTSAMNSNYQFLRGLVDGGGVKMSEDEILKDAAGDVAETTEDTTQWLYGYLLLAYHPLDLDDLEAYVAFSDSDAGRALNRALFRGFGQAYEDISYALGRAVALNMTAKEL